MKDRSHALRGNAARDALRHIGVRSEIGSVAGTQNGALKVVS
jgi:hypothetical protein